MAYPDIDLETEVVIVSQQTANAAQVLRIEENPSEKRVFANVSLQGSIRRLSLWEGDAYDQIGQWTDDDVVTRIKEILGA